jgi:hypothetical protein
MTLIKMLETRKGTEDGFTIRQFYEGEVYDVRENLARTFFAAGHAIKVRRLRPKRREKEETLFEE